jgi:hypothetical protein
MVARRDAHQSDVGMARGVNSLCDLAALVNDVEPIPFERIRQQFGAHPVAIENDDAYCSFRIQGLGHRYIASQSRVRQPEWMRNQSLAL